MNTHVYAVLPFRLRTDRVRVVVVGERKQFIPADVSKSPRNHSIKLSHSVKFIGMPNPRELDLATPEYDPEHTWSRIRCTLPSANRRVLLLNQSQFCLTAEHAPSNIRSTYPMNTHVYAVLPFRLRTDRARVVVVGQRKQSIPADVSKSPHNPNL